MLLDCRTILFATTRFAPEIRSGVESMAIGLVDALSDAGYKVTVITSGDSSEKTTTASGAVVLRYKSAFRKKDTFLWMIRSFLRFVHGRRIYQGRAERPVGIICNSPQYVVWARVLFPNTPVLFICHGMHRVDRLFQPRMTDRRPLRIRLMSRFENSVRDGQETFAYRMAHRVVVLSNGMREQIVKYARVSPRKIVQIPNGINCTVWENRLRDKHAEQTGLKIGYVGRLTPIKNVEYLIKALAKMNKELKWQCRIVGDGPEKPNLYKMVRENGLTSRVTLEGWCKDTREIYNWMDVFVLPSRWEGCPVSLLEAMASGLPCVGLKYDGRKFMADLSEMIIPGKNGFLVDGNAPESLTKVLCRFVENPSLQISMGYESRKRAISHFSWPAISAKYIDTIERCRKELSNEFWGHRIGE